MTMMMFRQCITTGMNKFANKYEIGAVWTRVKVAEAAE